MEGSSYYLLLRGVRIFLLLLFFISYLGKDRIPHIADITIYSPPFMGGAGGGSLSNPQNTLLSSHADARSYVLSCYAPRLDMRRNQAEYQPRYMR